MSAYLTAEYPRKPPGRPLTADQIPDAETGLFIWVCIGNWLRKRLDRCLSAVEQRKLALYIAARGGFDHKSNGLKTVASNSELMEVYCKGFRFSCARDDDTGDVVIYAIAEAPPPSDSGPGPDDTEPTIRSVVRDVRRLALRLGQRTFKKGHDASLAVTPNDGIRVVHFDPKRPGKAAFQRATLGACFLAAPNSASVELIGLDGDWPVLDLAASLPGAWHDGALVADSQAAGNMNEGLPAAPAACRRLDVAETDRPLVFEATGRRPRGLAGLQALLLRVVLAVLITAIGSSRFAFDLRLDVRRRLQRGAGASIGVVLLWQFTPANGAVHARAGRATGARPLPLPRTAWDRWCLARRGGTAVSLAGGRAQPGRSLALFLLRAVPASARVVRLGIGQGSHAVGDLDFIAKHGPLPGARWGLVATTRPGGAATDFELFGKSQRRGSLWQRVLLAERNDWLQFRNDTRHSVGDGSVLRRLARAVAVDAILHPRGDQVLERACALSDNDLVWELGCRPLNVRQMSGTTAAYRLASSHHTPAAALSAPAGLRGLALEICVDGAVAAPLSSRSLPVTGRAMEAHIVMTDRTNEDRDELIRRAMADLRAHVAGARKLRSFLVPTDPKIDVSSIRQRLGDTAEQFAARVGFGVTRDLVIAWECEEAELDPDMKELLLLLDLSPEEVTRELQSLRSEGRH